MGQKKQWHIPSWNKPSLEPRSLKAREGERGDDGLGACGCDKHAFGAGSDSVRIVYLYCNFCKKIIVASGDRFASVVSCEFFFLLGFGFLVFCFGILCWL
jgi:hypothetical protein